MPVFSLHIDTDAGMFGNVLLNDGQQILRNKFNA